MTNFSIFFSSWTTASWPLVHPHCLQTKVPIDTVYKGVIRLKTPLTPLRSHKSLKNGEWLYFGTEVLVKMNHTVVDIKRTAMWCLTLIQFSLKISSLLSNGYFGINASELSSDQKKSLFVFYSEEIFDPGRAVVLCGAAVKCCLLRKAPLEKRS